MRNKGKLGISLLIMAVSISLFGCGSKFTEETLNSEYYAYMNDVSTIQYDVSTNLELSSVIYGETFDMKWESEDIIDRVLASGEFISSREANVVALENEYSEKITNYVTGGKRYATYDGSGFFVVDYTPEPAVSKGPLRVIDDIISSTDKVLTNQTGELNGTKCNMITGRLSGAYLPYIFDDVNMTGLIDFKSQIDKTISFNYELYTDMKDKHPVQLYLEIDNVAPLMTSIITDMDSSNSGTIETDIKSFYVLYNFTGFNQMSSIVLPDAASNATETDNIDSLSLSAVSNKELTTEKNREVSMGNFSFILPDTWSVVSTLDTGYDGVDATGTRYDLQKIKHNYSESYVQLYNPVTLDLLVNELADSGIDVAGFTGEEAVEGTAEGEESGTVTVYNMELIKEAVVQYYSSKDYDSVRIDGTPDYVMSSKGDKVKDYEFIVFGDGEFIKLKVSVDGAELYSDYYDKTVSTLASSFKYGKKDESGSTEESAEGTEESTAENTEGTEGTEGSAEGTEVEALQGTIKNPYKANEQIVMKGIDLSSGNIINEYALIKSINTDKILVEQKLKESGVTTSGKAALVNMVITSDKVKYTDDSELDLIMEVSLVDKEGNKLGELLNSGKPLNKELQDGIIFKNDNETKQVVFAFGMPDSFDDETNLLMIKYNDPDLGERSLYVKLK